MFSLTKIVIGFTISAGADKHLGNPQGFYPHPFKQENFACSLNRWTRRGEPYATGL